MDPTSAVAKGGGQVGVPPDTPLVSPFWFTKNTAFVTASRNNKTTDSGGKRNNYV